MVYKIIIIIIIIYLFIVFLQNIPGRQYYMFLRQLCERKCYMLWFAAFVYSMHGWCYAYLMFIYFFLLLARVMLFFGLVVGGFLLLLVLIRPIWRFDWNICATLYISNLSIQFDYEFVFLGFLSLSISLPNVLISEYIVKWSHCWVLKEQGNNCNILTLK